MPLTALRKIGVAKEATYGTGVAPAAALPVTSASLNQVFGQELDNAVRGVFARTFHAMQGVTSVEGSIEGPVTPDEFGYFLLATLGSETFAALDTMGGTPATHTFTTLTTGVPPSLSIQDEDGVRKMRFLGMYVSSLSLRFNASEGLLSYTTEMQGSDVAFAPAESVPAYSATSKPLVNWKGTVTLGGSSFTKVTEVELTFNREVELLYGLRNAQGARNAAAQALEITGSFSFEFDAVADYDKYKNKTQEEIKLVLTDGTGTSKRGIEVIIPKGDYGEAAMERDFGSSYILATWSVRGVYDLSTSKLVDVKLYSGRTAAF